MLDMVVSGDEWTKVGGPKMVKISNKNENKF